MESKKKECFGLIFKMGTPKQRLEFEACYLIILAVIRLRRKRKANFREGRKKGRFWVRNIFQKWQELRVFHTSHSLGSSGSLNVVQIATIAGIAEIKSWRSKRQSLGLPRIAKVTVFIDRQNRRTDFSRIMTILAISAII